MITINALGFKKHPHLTFSNLLWNPLELIKLNGMRKILNLNK